MAATQVRGAQVLDKTIQRADLDDGLPSGPTGNAVVRKVVQGTGITLSSTGFDAGTGDVTVNLANPIPTGNFPAFTGDVTTSAGGVTTTYNNAVPTGKAGTPTAGTVGQGLYKNTSTNYDYSWKQPAAFQLASSVTTAGTTSIVAAGVHAGLAGSITPTTTGRILVIISGYMSNSFAATYCAVLGVRYGTGTAPVHGATATGTLAAGSSGAVGTSAAANNFIPFSVTAVVTGLTLNTAYWLDCTYATQSASGTAKLTATSVSAIEI